MLQCLLRCYHNIRDTSPDIQNTYKSINIQYLSDVWYIFSQNSRFLNAFPIFSNIFECLHAFLWIIQYFLYFPHRIIEFWSSAAEAAACKCAAARLSNSPYASFHTNTSIWKQCEKEREREGGSEWQLSRGLWYCGTAEIASHMAWIGACTTHFLH